MYKVTLNFTAFNTDEIEERLMRFYAPDIKDCYRYAIDDDIMEKTQKASTLKEFELEPVYDVNNAIREYIIKSYGHVLGTINIKDI